MSLGLIFWIIMLLWLVFALAWQNGWAGPAPWAPHVNSLMLFLLFLMLGWHAFGAPIRG